MSRRSGLVGRSSKLASLASFKVWFLIL